MESDLFVVLLCSEKNPFGMFGVVGRSTAGIVACMHAYAMEPKAKRCLPEYRGYYYLARALFSS